MAGLSGSNRPTDNELKVISKSIELCNIILHQEIPLEGKLCRMKKLLVDANVNFSNKYLGRNAPLHLSVFQGNVEVTNLLIKCGADVNKTNKAGETPLHVAVIHDKIDIVRLLIRNKADANIKNKEDESPLDIAKKNKNNQGIVTLLETDSGLAFRDDANLYKDDNTSERDASTADKQDQNSSDDFVNLPKTHAASGAKNSIHGTVYQLKLLMLFLVRALSMGFSFQLGTEVDEAEQFDDIVFKYVNGNDVKSLYLQAKHKENPETGKITAQDLLSNDKKAPFSLLKYYKSYHKIKLRDSEKADKIDFVICTNTTFKFSEPYKLTGNRIGGIVFTFQDINTSYHEFFKEGICYKLVLDELTLQELRDLFAESIKVELKPFEDKISSTVTTKEANKLKVEIGLLKEMLCTVEDDTHIRAFLNKLIFAVCQPNETKLDTLIKTEFGASNNSIHLLDVDLLNDSFHKQMFDWFKSKGSIKGKEGTFLSNEDAKRFVNSTFDKLNNLISTGISKAYPEQLKTYNINFNKNKLAEVLKVLTKHKIVHLIPQNETRLTAICVDQAIQNSVNYAPHGSYISMRLETLLPEGIQELTMQALTSPDTRNTLVIDGSSTTEEISPIQSKLLTIFGNHLSSICGDDNQKQIILIANENHSLVDKMRHLPGFYAYNVEYVLKDLVPESQVTLLNTPVLFQGKRVELNKLIDTEDSECLETLPIEELMSDTLLIVASELTTSSGYNEAFYIDMKLRTKTVLTRNIYEAIHQKTFDDKVAKTEEEFGQICKQYPQKNVHLILFREEISFWVKTRGSIEAIRPFVDINKHCIYKEETLLHSMKQDRVVIISDSAGMGKSTILTRISKKIKINCPEFLVFKIDLNKCTDVIERVNSTKLDSATSIDFLCDHLIMVKTPLEHALFKRKGKLVLLFDGFDEISPDYNDTLLNLIKNVLEVTDAQIWITTRPFMQEDLENKLLTFSFTLEPFSESDQVDFLTKYWTHMLNLQEYNFDRITTFAKRLVNLLTASISDPRREFTRVPLQIKMLADCFVEDLKQFLDSDLALAATTQLDTFNLVDVYKKFIIQKFNAYHLDKAMTVTSNLAVKSTQKILLERYMKQHQMLGLFLVLSTNQIKLMVPDYLNPINSDDKVMEDLHRIGIVQIINNTPHFIHRTFAEYFVSVFIMDLLKKTQYERTIQHFILSEILVKENYRTIRAFLNGLLANNQPEINYLDGYSELLCELAAADSKNEKLSNFGRAAEEGSDEILVYLCNCAKEDERRLKFLLTRGNGNSLLHMAAFNNRAAFIATFFTWIKDNIEKEEGNAIIVTNLTYIGRTGETILHLAVYSGHGTVLETLLQWIKDNVSHCQAILREMILAADNFRITLLHRATLEGNTSAIVSLLTWTQNNTSAYDSKVILREMLLATDKSRKTVLHYCASNRGLHRIAISLFQWVTANMDCGDNQDILRTMMMAREENGWTLLHLAAYFGNSELMEVVLDWTQSHADQGQGRAILRSMLLAEDGEGWTILHRAAWKGDEGTVEILLKWIRVGLDDDTLRKFLGARHSGDKSATEEAIFWRHSGVVEKLKRFIGKQQALRSSVP